MYMLYEMLILRTLLRYDWKMIKGCKLDIKSNNAKIPTALISYKMMRLWIIVGIRLNYITCVVCNLRGVFNILVYHVLQSIRHCWREEGENVCFCCYGAQYSWIDHQWRGNWTPTCILKLVIIRYEVCILFKTSPIYHMLNCRILQNQMSGVWDYSYYI